MYITRYSSCLSMTSSMITKRGMFMIGDVVGLHLTEEAITDLRLITCLSLKTGCHARQCQFSC